jgi:hypothetical protein
MKVNSHNKFITKRLTNQIHKTRIKNEIKFWYTKKSATNQILYNLHLKNSKEWGNLWDIINQNITNKIDMKMNKKYNTLNNKLSKLREFKDRTHTTNNQNKHTFYKRIENLSNVTFTDNKMQLLNKGLKYNLHHQHKKWIQTLAIKADTAINLLADKDQSYTRQFVANNIQKLVNKQKTLKEQRTTIHTKRNHQEWNTLKNIKQKLNDNQLVVTKADKGNTLVILHKDDYYKKN